MGWFVPYCCRNEALTLKYKLDNQFELVFVVGFQKILTLTYVDKLIDDVLRLFRDKYLTEIQQQSALSLLNGTFDFQNDFLRLLRWEAFLRSKGKFSWFKSACLSVAHQYLHGFKPVTFCSLFLIVLLICGIFFLSQSCPLVWVERPTSLFSL